MDLSSLLDMSFENINKLPYGAILLDTNGEIEFYNDFEQKLSGRDASRVVGKNFFSEVAPCTNVKEFRSSFDDIVAGKREESDFDFVFTFVPPMNVRINMIADRAKTKVWLTVSKK